MKKLFCLLFLIFLFLPLNVFAESEIVTLSKCVDGDTAKFLINGKIYSTRFLAIDTPETVKPNTPVQPYGKAASNYTCKSLKNAKKIILEYDKNSTKEDKYGRRLAWIFVDDQLLQKKLISKGYAKVAYLYGNYRYTDLLKNAEKNAKLNSVGIWSGTSNEKENLLDEIFEKIYRYITKEIKSML